jgi:hypothetical protein
MRSGAGGRPELANKEEMANGEPVLDPIAALSFREAKTMPECPHEYVVRTPENEAAYVALFNLIVEQGVAEKWRGRRYQYFYPGDDWKYWRMTADIRYSRVLNRCRVDTPQPSWTVEAYNDEGNIVKLQRTADICDAVELAKELEEEYPKVDIITPKGSVFPRREGRH